MATRQTTQATEVVDDSYLDNLINLPKPGQINLIGGKPFAVRANCKEGKFALSDTAFIGTEITVGILRLEAFYGNLGVTEDTEWLQLFYIPTPGTTILPKDCCCVTYLKTRSLDNFSAVMTALQSEFAAQLQKENPSFASDHQGLSRAVSRKIAAGVFRVFFVPHRGKKGAYYSINFEWRERQDGEIDQIKLIQQFMQQNASILFDGRGTAQMKALSGMTAEDRVALLKAGDDRRKMRAQLAAAS